MEAAEYEKSGQYLPLFCSIFAPPHINISKQVWEGYQW